MYGLVAQGRALKDQAGDVPGSPGVSSVTSGKLASPSSQYLPRKKGMRENVRSLL